MKIKGYCFQSCFAPYLEQFIQEKRDAGFIYEAEVWKLKHFDALCIESGVPEPVLTRELAMRWGRLRENEALSTCSNRMSVLRQFALYLTSLGIEAYIPTRFYKSERPVVHIMSDKEIEAFFVEIDSYVPGVDIPSFHRLACEYKVIFRLIYCCGLRISEARKLRWKDVDQDRRTIRILQSKGRKDRLVYLSGDMSELLRSYESVIQDKYHCTSEWVFPAREEANCLGTATLDKQFRDCWKRTSYAAHCDKAPTVHCLRHTFVVKRMNMWMESGISLKEMMPFLSRYLGHTSPDETYYYYHQVDSTFRIVRKRDRTSSRVIPEVLSYE